MPVAYCFEFVTDNQGTLFESWKKFVFVPFVCYWHKDSLPFNLFIILFIEIGLKIGITFQSSKHNYHKHLRMVYAHSNCRMGQDHLLTLWSYRNPYNDMSCNRIDIRCKCMFQKPLVIISFWKSIWKYKKNCL